MTTWGLLIIRPIRSKIICAYFSFKSLVMIENIITAYLSLSIFKLGKSLKASPLHIELEKLLKALNWSLQNRKGKIHFTGRDQLDTTPAWYNTSLIQHQLYTTRETRFGTKGKILSVASYKWLRLIKPLQQGWFFCFMLVQFWLKWRRGE